MQAGLEYYTTMFRALKREFPHVHIKALTAVEIAHIARIEKMSWDDVLIALREAGLDTMPGGGAETFSAGGARTDRRQEARRRGLHRRASRGAPARHPQRTARCCTATSRRIEDRVAHLRMLRDLQDETGGFLAYIPLAYHPDDNELGVTLGRTGTRDDRLRRPAEPRRRPAVPRQLRPHQDALDHGDAVPVADGAAVRRQRHGRHRRAREDLSRRRRAHAAGDDARRDPPADSRRGEGPGGARLVLQRASARSTTTPAPAAAAAVAAA